MTQLENALGRDTASFIAQATEEATLAFRIFRETGTLTASGTVGFIERIPGENKLLSLDYGGPFKAERPLEPAVFGLDGTVYVGNARCFGAGRYNELFQRHPDITTLSHVHSPYLGAWAQTHRTFPIRYAPVQRYLLTRELPVYIDRRQPEQEFIVDRIRIDSRTLAILEANGGATVWGKHGLRKTAEFILILEEAARLQLLAEAIGGSREHGPSALLPQFQVSGLPEQTCSLVAFPPTTN